MANPIKNFVSRLTTAFGAPVADNNNLNNPALESAGLFNWAGCGAQTCDFENVCMVANT